ncbi:MAG TPA: hypothetical protein DCP91_08965 [Eggerthellaceae bacterium]|nr:hypothetical protein [Eggerthellaceae bacterium]
MSNGIIAKIGMAACACVLAGVLAGCGPNAGTSATDEQQANRAYMSQVNEAMVQLDDQLDQFVDAVSRGDVVNMRTQADNAYKVLDSLADIEAPEAMKDIRDKYVDGTDKMRKALDAYIDLYAEVSRAGESYDWSAYEKRVKEVQDLYDEGVKALKSADETVAGASAGSEASGSAASSEGAASSEESSASESAAASESSSASAASESASAASESSSAVSNA